jgi:hypothetical protein
LTICVRPQAHSSASAHPHSMADWGMRPTAQSYAAQPPGGNVEWFSAQASSSAYGNYTNTVPSSYGGGAARSNGFEDEPPLLEGEISTV